MNPTFHCDVCNLTFVECLKHVDTCDLYTIIIGGGGYEDIGKYDCSCPVVDEPEMSYHVTECDWLKYYTCSGYEEAAEFMCQCSQRKCEHLA